jgi:hypothetical protein
MKINWGTGIAIFLFAFIVFILSFVYKTFTNDKYDHHLVSDDYYKDEINYQQEIDALDNAKKLNTHVKIENTAQGIKITFPTDNKIIEGTVQFQRASDIKLDLTIPINLENNTLIIKDEKLVKGIYNVKIVWSANNTKYQFNEKYTY